jgi:hypothetical protein
MDKWFKDILPDKDSYHNRGRDQMRKKGGPEFECLCFCPVSFVLSVPWFTASDYPFNISNFHQFAIILNSLVLYLSSNKIIVIKFD